MWHKFKQRLAPPTVAHNTDLNRVANLLNTILLALVVVFTINTAVSFIFNPSALARLLNVGTLFLSLVLFGILRAGNIRAASWLTIIIFWTAVIGVVFFVTGLEMVATTSMLVLVVMTGVLVGRRAAFIVAGVTIIASALYLVLVESGVLPTPAPLPNQLVNLIPSAGNLLAITIILNLTLRDLNNALDDVRHSNAELKKAQDVLERRVAERTQALETSMEVSRSLSTILDLQKLVVEVVERVRSAFDYYHVHIYLFDEARENLRMTGGTGDAGLTMLAQGHQIPIGKGLVGYAAMYNEPVLILDVTQSDDWLPNPLLPDTKAETAVPIAIRDEVLGVLDVQQNHVGRLTEEDVRLLQSIANQVAIALRNARAYERVQARVRQEAILNQILQRIQTATDVESVLQVAARELGQVLGAKYTDVHIGRAPAENGRSPASNQSTMKAAGGETR